MMTREIWDDLPDKAKWDIQVALRGPDSYYGEVLKWFTTSVIRGQMKDVFRVGGLVNPDLQLVILPSGESESIYRTFRAAGPLAWKYSHFVEHIGAAANWIGLPKMRVVPEVWHESMRASNTRQAIELILQAANAWVSQGVYDKLYRVPHIKELERHMKSSRIYV